MKVETRDHLRKMYHEKLRPMEMYSLTLSRLDVVFDMTVLELQKRTETKIYELKLAELDLHDHLIKEKMKDFWNNFNFG